MSCIWSVSYLFKQWRICSYIGHWFKLTRSRLWSVKEEHYRTETFFHFLSGQLSSWYFSTECTCEMRMLIRACAIAYSRQSIRILHEQSTCRHIDKGSCQNLSNRGGSRITGKGIHMCKGFGVHFADLISFLLNITWKWNNLVTLWPNYFHFHWIFKNGERDSSEPPPLGSATVPLRTRIRTKSHNMAHIYAEPNIRGALHRFR